MADRREFLRYAVASSLPLGTAALSFDTAAAAPAARPIAIRHVVIDARHAECRAFGASLAERGVTLHALADGDATELWLRTIGPAWRDAPVAVAGLTRPPALFVLEQLAFAHGLRVVHHAEHVVRVPGGPATHSILRTPLAAAGTVRLDRPDARWPHLAAEWIAQFAADAPATARPGPTSAGLLPALPAGAELLTSWIIAAA